MLAKELGKHKILMDQEEKYWKISQSLGIYFRVLQAAAGEQFHSDSVLVKAKDSLVDGGKKGLRIYVCVEYIFHLSHTRREVGISEMVSVGLEWKC